MVSRISDRSLAVEPYSIATINFFVSLERRLCNAVVDNLLKELLMKGIKMNIKGKCMQLLFPLSSIIRKKKFVNYSSGKRIVNDLPGFTSGDDDLNHGFNCLSIL
jgi:hypothetical protein